MNATGMETIGASGKALGLKDWASQAFWGVVAVRYAHLSCDA